MGVLFYLEMRENFVYIAESSSLCSSQDFDIPVSRLCILLDMHCFPFGEFFLYSTNVFCLFYFFIFLSHIFRFSVLNVRNQTNSFLIRKSTPLVRAMIEQKKRAKILLIRMQESIWKPEISMQGFSTKKIARRSKLLL